MWQKRNSWSQLQNLRLALGLRLHLGAQSQRRQRKQSKSIFQQGEVQYRLMASLLVVVVTTPARKKGLRTAAGRGRHRHFPLSFVSPAAKLTLATSQPPTVMSIYRGRGRGRRGGGCSSAQNTNLATTVQRSGGHGRKQTDARNFTSSPLTDDPERASERRSQIADRRTE